MLWNAPPIIIPIAKSTIFPLRANSLNSLNDEIGRLSDFYFSQSIAKNKSDLDEIKNMINKSTKEDIVDAVKDIQLDTIYFLSK